MSCTQEALANISADATFSSWKQLSDAQLNQIASVINNTPTASQQQIFTQQQKSIFDTLNCLQGKIREIQGTSSGASRAQEQILATKKQIQEEEQNVAIAKDRLNYLRNRATDVSYYESWFPLDRPLKKTTIPILLSISVFLTLLSLAYLLAAMGFELLVKFTWEEVQYPEWVTAIFSQLTLSFWITLAVLIAVVWYYESNKVTPTDSLPSKGTAP
jgi:hypothetical protein